MGGLAWFAWFGSVVGLGLGWDSGDAGTAILKYLLVNCQKKQKRINPTSIHLNTFKK